MLLSPLLSFLAFIGVAAAYPDPGVVSGNVNVHDPGIARGPDGTYIMIATGHGLPVRTSKDRTHWTYVGDVFNKAPSATDKYTRNSDADLWAPEIQYVNGKFMLYYCASSFATHVSGIFLAESSTGLPGTWSDKGLVLESTSKNNYNAIDPALNIVDEDWYLTFGSFWAGIFQVKLNPSTGKPAKGASIKNIAQRPSSVGGAIEAPYIVEHGNYFYLFTSWDKCCASTSSTYKTAVTRSHKITGPYVDANGKSALSGGGTIVLASHDSIIGPGGASVLASEDAIFYHYYLPSGSVLGINLLNWSSGWPVAY